jgi:hypothetical protein
MNSKKRISVVGKHSRIVTSKKDLWFYSEANDTDRNPVFKKNSFENDRLSIKKQDNKNLQTEESIKFSSKKGCTFVVDWQMTETF